MWGSTAVPDDHATITQAPQDQAAPANGRRPPPAEYRWKPGQSGNPKGRPKGKSITECVRETLERELNGKVTTQILAETVVKHALQGKYPFLKELWDRLEGRPEEKHEITLPSAKTTFEDAAAAYGALSDQEKIELAREHDRVHLLPPRLRELAALNTPGAQP
jgi:hypothetical protein